MPATKPSLTKLATHWQTTLRPSNTFTLILWVTTALGFMTLWHCPVPILAKIATITLTGIASIGISIRSRSTVQIQWQNTEIRYTTNDLEHVGQLASGSYYSALVIVLAIKDTAGKIHRVPVWHDSVNAYDYSWLLMRLKTSLPHTLL